jgi:hypothetical protein
MSDDLDAAVRRVLAPPRKNPLLGETPRDARQMVALLFSIAGAAVLTGVAGWIVWILWRGGWPIETAGARIEALAWALLGLLATVGIVLISLGMVITRRTVRAGIGLASFEASGGDDPPAAASVTTTTTVQAPPAPPKEDDQP